MDNQEKGIRKIQLTSEMKTSFMIMPCQLS